MLSESVSKALMKYGGDEAEESALFAHTFDNFFDCLNISNYTNTKHQGWGKALSNSLSLKHKHLKFFKHKHNHKHYPGIHDLS